MAGETTITVIGNLTADPELRFTPGGDAVANFTIASTPRTFDRQTNDWKDGDTLFLRSSIWREAAENATESLVKGQRVIAQGVLKTRKYTPKEGGEERTVTELEVIEIGPSLKYAKAVVTRTPQGGNGGGQAPQQQGQWNGQQQAQQPAQGGYQQAPAQQAQGGWGGPQQGAQQPAAQQDPWAAPVNPNANGWGNQQQQGGPSF